MSNPTHCQCLLFVKDEKDKNAEPNVPVAKAFALLPEAFIREQPAIRVLFQENNILLLSSENVSRLFGEDDLTVVEVLLDENPASPVSVDPLTVFTDTRHLFFSYDDLKLIFPNVAIRHVFDPTVVAVRPAVDEVNSEVVESLLKQRTDLLSSERFNSPNFLHMAARRGHEYFIRVLLECGEQVDVPDRDLSTPLHEAARYGHAQIVLLLINRGATVDAKNEEGETPLFKTSDTQCEISRQEKVTEILLQNGADANSFDIANRTPIFNAAAKGFVELVDTLLKYGARLDVIDKHGKSALEFAYSSHPPTFQHLLESAFVDLAQLEQTSIHHIFLKDYRKHRNVYKSTFPDSCVILLRHLIKVTTLGLCDPVDLGINLNVSWSGDRDNFEVSEEDPGESDRLKSECEVEAARLKAETIPDTSISFYDILGYDVCQAARILKSKSAAQMVDSNEFKQRFPIYGNIVKYHIRQATLRNSLKQYGIKICEFLFGNGFKILPYEMKEKIVSYCSNKDLLILKAVCPVSKIQH